MTILHHRGYVGSAEPDDSGYHGKLLNMRDVVTYAADSLPALNDAFKAAIDDYEQTCAELGDKAQGSEKA